MTFTEKDHTFVVCAYKENPYLIKCLRSLLAQTKKSNVIIETSTPSDYISVIAEKFGVEVFVNSNPSSLGGDWNYAYSCASTPLVTIAHQDDYYEDDFLEETLKSINGHETPLIAFTDYYEIRGKQKVISNKNLRIKRIMLSALKGKKAQEVRLLRRFILSFGDPICCPSMTFIKKEVGENPFREDLKNSCDYDLLERLSSKNGSFVFVNKLLMGHRIYEESTTTENLKEDIRTIEDEEIMSRLSNPLMAKVVGKLYKLSEKSNEIKQ